MSIESLSELRVPKLPDGHPEPLHAIIADLETALAGDRPFDATEAVRRALEFLLRYYTGVATGLLSKLDPARPEIEALASHMDSLVHYERLLRFSLSALETRHDNPAQLSLRRVFFSNARATAPLLHTRWLRVAGPPEVKLPELSTWAVGLDRLRNQGDEAGCRREVTHALEILACWLDASADFFGAWRHRYRSKPGAPWAVVGLDGRECSFDLMPVMEVDGSAAVRTLGLGIQTLRETDRVSTWLAVEPEADMELPEPEFALPDPIAVEQTEVPPPPVTEQEEFTLAASRPALWIGDDDARHDQPFDPPGGPSVRRPDRQLFAAFLDFAGIAAGWRESGTQLSAHAGDRFFAVVDRVAAVAELFPAFLESTGIAERLRQENDEVTRIVRSATALEAFYRQTGLLSQIQAAEQAALAAGQAPPETVADQGHQRRLEVPRPGEASSDSRMERLALRGRMLEPPAARQREASRHIPEVPPTTDVETPESDLRHQPPTEQHLAPAPGHPSQRRRRKIALPSKAFLERGPRRRGVAPWTGDETRAFEELLEQRYPPLEPQLIPHFLVEPVERSVRERACGYVLVKGAQGVGKSLLCRSLVGQLKGRSGEPFPVILFPVKQALHCDSETFIELLNEFIARHGQGLDALDYQVTRDLCVRFAAEPLEARFSAYLSELALVNDSRLVLVLDGLEEALEAGGDVTLADFLPARLPTGVYLVLAYNPPGVSARTRARLFELEQGQAEVVEIDPEAPPYRKLVSRYLEELGPRDRSWSQEVISQLARVGEGRLGPASLLANLLSCSLVRRLRDLPGLDNLYDVLFEALERRFGDRFLYLFLLLATSDEPVTVHELSIFGIRREDAVELVHNLPCLFRCVGGADPGLTLAHRSVRLYLQEAYHTRYARVCQRLARFAYDELCDVDDPVGAARKGLDVLEQTVGRLYTWALDSQDAGLLEEVCDSEEVDNVREAVFAELEHRGLYHRKATILDGYRTCLGTLVERFGQGRFREQLAWALASRGLAMINLGHCKPALADEDRAIGHFVVLVEQEQQEDARNGLAAAYNRRAEAHRHLGQSGQALEDASQAVSHYRLAVDRQGRQDLRYLLALAVHNRGLVHRQRQTPELARKDFDEAIDMYSRLVDVEKRKTQSRHLAQAHRSRAALMLEHKELEMSINDASEAIRLLEHLVENEGAEHLSNDLASAHNDRGAALHRLGRLEQARQDYLAAISTRTFLVSQGRLDVRTDLARTLTNCGLVLASLLQFEEAGRSHRQALELLDKLVEDEGRRDLFAARAFARVCQAELARQQQRVSEAIDDYTRAAIDYERATRAQPALASDLGHCLNSLGAACLGAGELDKAVKSLTQALECLANDPGREGYHYDLALAYANRQEGHRRLGDLPAALEDAGHTVRLYSLLVEDGQLELAPELARSHIRRGRLASECQDLDTVVKDASRGTALFLNLVREQQRPEYRQELADAYELRAAAHRLRGSLDQALDDVSQAVDIYEELLVEQPDLETEAQLARGLDLRGRVLVRIGSPEQALEDFARAAEHFRRLAERHPQGGWHSPMAAALLARARANLESDQVAAAVRDLVDAFSSGQLLAEGEHMATVRHLVKSLKLRALRLLRARKPAEAIELYGHLIGLLSALGVQRNDEFLAELAHSYYYRGWARCRRRDAAGARSDFDRAAELYGPLVAAGGGSGPTAMLARTYADRASVLEGLGFSEGAQMDLDRAVELLDGLDAPDQLAAALAGRGRLQSRQEQFEPAQQDLSAAAELYRSLGRQDLLALCLTELAETRRSLGQFDAARAVFEEVAAVYAQLNRAQPGRYTGELVRCLVARSGLARPDMAQDTGALDALVEAVKTTTSTARGGSLPESFANLPRQFLTQALELAEGEPSDGFGTLLEAVLEMGEVLLDVEGTTHWVSCPDLFLKIGSLLPGLGHEGRQAHCMTLASAYCRREVETYGDRSIPRLVRCLYLLGHSLTRGQIPAYLERVGPCFNLLARRLSDYRPTQNVEVEINNTARAWQALPASILARARVSKARLNEIRRW